MLPSYLRLAGGLAVVLAAQAAFAQTPPPDPLLVTVTANRSPTAIQRTGSAITVIGRDEIEKANPASLADVLRGVPGVSLTETGGPGGATALRLRGNDARHTLVLIDGVRVNDPTDVGGGFDFATLSALDIERIEVLRGPQSALYGSDAIGGVVNIITRRGRGKPQAYLQVEGGSYGTRSLRAGVSGGDETLSYAFSLNRLDTAGFSRFGHRVRRIEDLRFTPLEPDSLRRDGASARISWRPLQGVEFEAGGTFSRSLAQTDNAFGLAEDTAGKDRAFTGSGFARASVETLEGQWKHSVMGFAATTDRRSRCGALGFNCFYQDPADPTNFLAADIADTRFKGERRGVEYQGDIRLGQLGTVIYGVKRERETASFSAQALAPTVVRSYASRADRTTNSVFALHQIRLGGQTDVSAGLRYDKPDDTEGFLTWRVTAAHRIAETGTKLRASIGTGAKAPSLYQQFSVYGPLAARDPALRPETSLGVDAGIDQELFGGRLKLSATIYRNKLKNLIEYDPNRGLLNTAFAPFVFPIGKYVNIARARTQGVELSGEALIVEGVLKARASFAWQDARARTGFGTLQAGDELLRRPEQQGAFTLVITPLQGLTIEPTITYVGRQVDAARLPGTFGSFRRDLAPYAKVGARVEYVVSPNLTVYARGENLTNARHQEVFNYGTAGRSAYAGLRVTW
jgi:vitamin B12 transporter